MKELIKKDWNYTLLQDKEKYILKVLCGTVGLYELFIELDESEKQSYQEQGKSFIDSLAQKIQSTPSEFTKRNIGN